MTKSIVTKCPDEFLLVEFIERIIILKKIEQGREDVKKGKINTEEHAKAN